MQCQSLEAGEATGGRRRRLAANRRRKEWRSRRCRAERVTNTPGCWLWFLFKQGWQLPQTSPCLKWHTFTLTCADSLPLYGALLSFFLLLGLIRPLWLPSARSTAWQLNHLSNQDVASSLVMKYQPDHPLSFLCLASNRCSFWSHCKTVGSGCSVL